MSSQLDELKTKVEHLQGELKATQYMLVVSFGLALEGRDDDRRDVIEVFLRSVEIFGATDQVSVGFKKALFETATELKTGPMP